MSQQFGKDGFDNRKLQDSTVWWESGFDDASMEVGIQSVTRNIFGPSQISHFGEIQVTSNMAAILKTLKFTC